MRVMGIDPSTRMGVAVVESGNKVLHAEEIEFKKLTGFERISRLVLRVLELKEEYNPDLLVLEEMIVGHAASAIVVIQVATLLRYFLWQEGFQYLEVHPSRLKVFAGGNGNTKKEQVMMFVSKRWGFESATNNIADAVVLGIMGLAAIHGAPTKVEAAVIEKVLNDSPVALKQHLEALSK